MRSINEVEYEYKARKPLSKEEWEALAARRDARIEELEAEVEGLEIEVAELK